jgi:sortase A
MTLQRQRRIERFAISGKLILFFLVSILLLAGCGSNEPKQVIQIRVRSNRVEAQSPRNQFNSQAFVPTPVPTPVYTPISTPLVKSTYLPPLPTVFVPLLPPATPTAVTIPIGRPDRVVIPAIGVDTEIESVEPQTNQIGKQWFENWQTAAYAAGFHSTSALLGQAGNTVISGHNNIDGAVFQNLYELQPGEIVQLYADGYRYDYIVEEQFVVRERDVPLEQRMQNATWIHTTIDERVTLVSCWPPTGNDFRVIVVAKPLAQMVGTGATNSN